MKAETLAALQDARTKRRAVTLATRLSDAAEALVYRDGAKGELAGDAAIVAAAQRAMDIGKSETIDVSGAKVFLNVYVPLEEATRRLKLVPLDGDTMRTARDLGINFGDHMPGELLGR